MYVAYTTINLIVDILTKEEKNHEIPLNTDRIGKVLSLLISWQGRGSTGTVAAWALRKWALRWSLVCEKFIRGQPLIKGQGKKQEKKSCQGRGLTKPRWGHSGVSVALQSGATVIQNVPTTVIILPAVLGRAYPRAKVETEPKAAELGSRSP